MRERMVIFYTNETGRILKEEVKKRRCEQGNAHRYHITTAESGHPV